MSCKSVKIHRRKLCLWILTSTFVYQLQRIRDITKMDLDSADQRLELLIYFRILEYTGIKLAEIKGKRKTS